MVFGLSTSIFRLEHFGNFHIAHCIEVRAIKTVFLRQEGPLELEVSLSQSSPPSQASWESLAHSLLASAENCHNGPAVPQAVQGRSRGRRPQKAGASTLGSPTVQHRKDLVAAGGTLKHLLESR